MLWTTFCLTFECFSKFSKIPMFFLKCWDHSDLSLIHISEPTRQAEIKASSMKQKQRRDECKESVDISIYDSCFGSNEVFHFAFRVLMQHKLDMYSRGGVQICLKNFNNAVNNFLSYFWVFWQIFKNSHFFLKWPVFPKLERWELYQEIYDTHTCLNFWKTCQNVCLCKTC